MTMSGSVAFFVPGKPATQGSKTAIPIRRKSGRLGALVFDSNKNNRTWRNAVAAEAYSAMQANSIPCPFDGPVRLEVRFEFLRPKGHFGKGGVRKSAPTHHTVKPDLSKLVRAIEDALKGVVWRDDSQVVRIETRKRYGDRPGAWVKVAEESREQTNDKAEHP